MTQATIADVRRAIRGLDGATPVSVVDQGSRHRAGQVYKVVTFDQEPVGLDQQVSVLFVIEVRPHGEPI